jgi:D-alanyl-D-alanine carboxypeptidase (penicillin-binding protein 5/6)
VTLSRKARKDMKVTIDYNQPLSAPVAAGQEVGKIIVTAPDAANVEAPLYAASAVERMGPFGRAAIVAGQLIWGNRH